MEMGEDIALAVHVHVFSFGVGPVIVFTFLRHGLMKVNVSSIHADLLRQLLGALEAIVVRQGELI